MALLYSGNPLSGTASDDFLIDYDLDGADTTIFGGDGDDLVYGDFYNYFLPGIAGATQGSGPMLTASGLVWSIDENPDIANSTSVPHTTIVGAATGGATEWYQVTVLAGQTITLDIDYGSHVIGESFDSVLELYNSSGTLMATNDQSTASLGGFGSSNMNDSFLEFTFSTAGVYYIGLGKYNGVGPMAALDAGATYVLNVSLTGFNVTAPPTVPGSDTIFGGAGSDVLHGLSGDDYIEGGDGVDLLTGGTGRDSLYGGDGIDELFGGDDSDLLDGGLGDDYLYGAAGKDLLFGGLGSDRLFGDDGKDRLDGGAQNDSLYGGAGDDTLIGGAGIDSYDGGSGVDVIDYSDITETITMDMTLSSAVFGVTTELFVFVEGALLGSGHDLVKVANGATNNQFYGGTGTDAVVFLDLATGLSFNLETGVTSIGSRFRLFENAEGSNGHDRIVGSTVGNFIGGNGGNDTIYGQDGNDNLLGDSGSDSLYGGAGTDQIYGGIGSDRAFGGLGNDAMAGGANDDILFGDQGSDSLTGDGGDDILVGGDGNDFLNGGLGNDTLSGGAGADDFLFQNGEGADRINAYEQGLDDLILDSGLWTGSLTAAQVVSNFATINGAGTFITLDFGGGDVLVLQAASGLNLASLAADITII